MATKTYGDKRKAMIEPVRVLGVELDRDAPGATIDGVTLAEGDSVADAGEDGVGIFDYVSAAKPMTRRDDRPDGDCETGTMFYVKEGTVFGETIVVAHDDGDVTIYRATPRCIYDADSAPTANDDEMDGFSVGSQWFDVSAGKMYVCMDATAASGSWKEVTFAA